MFKLKMSFVKNKEYEYIITLLKHKFNLRYRHV